MTTTHGIDPDIAKACDAIRAQIAESRALGNGPKWIMVMFDEAEALVDGVECGHLRLALQRANRDIQILTRQLDAFHDTDKGALQIRCDEQAGEILELKAQLAKLGVIA